MHNFCGEAHKPVVATLELVATEHPALLPWLMEILNNSPARWPLQQLAQAWGARLEHLVSVAARTAHDLNHLETRRGLWSHPRQIVRDPNLPALHAFALARWHRLDGSRARVPRLAMIVRRLADSLETERRRRWIEDFLADSGDRPAPPVNLRPGEVK